MSDISNFEPLWGIWYVESILGEGSFGKVYKARREEFGRTYYAAIKHISIPQSKSESEGLYSEGYADTEESVHDYYKQVADNLIDEVDLLRKLHGNSNIVAYEDHLIIKKPDEPGYDIFIRMELLKGLTAVMRETSLTQNLVVKMGIDICSALEVLGQKNLIHRDIKPANIFVNDAGMFKLGDFGVSRVLEGTLSGMSKKGTYNFMAPEVYKGETYNTTIDIYSLGIMMYRLLNGNRAPFLPLSSAQVNFSENEKAIVRRMSGENLPNPAFADDCISDIVLKACAYNPSDRYQTPEEFKEELLSYATDKSPKVVPVIKPVAEDTVRPEVLMPVAIATKTTEEANLPDSKNVFLETELLEQDRTRSLFACRIPDSVPTKGKAVEERMPLFDNISQEDTYSSKSEEHVKSGNIVKGIYSSKKVLRIFAAIIGVVLIGSTVVFVLSNSSMSTNSSISEASSASYIPSADISNTTPSASPNVDVLSPSPSVGPNNSKASLSPSVNNSVNTPSSPPPTSSPGFQNVNYYLSNNQVSVYWDAVKHAEIYGGSLLKATDESHDYFMLYNGYIFDTSETQTSLDISTFEDGLYELDINAFMKPSYNEKTCHIDLYFCVENGIGTIANCYIY